MREILFRGKDKKTGKWVCGDLITEHENGDLVYACVLKQNTTACFSVDPKTVGQYTGFNDKNGTKIFEGDIVQTKYERLCKVVWRSFPSGSRWDFIPIECVHTCPDSYDLWNSKNLLIVGNIHDIDIKSQKAELWIEKFYKQYKEELLEYVKKMLSE